MKSMKYKSFTIRVLIFSKSIFCLLGSQSVFFLLFVLFYSAWFPEKSHELSEKLQSYSSWKLQIIKDFFIYIHRYALLSFFGTNFDIRAGKNQLCLPWQVNAGQGQLKIFKFECYFTLLTISVFCRLSRHNDPYQCKGMHIITHVSI